MSLWFPSRIVSALLSSTPISNAQPRPSPRRKLPLMACTLVTHSRARPVKAVFGCARQHREAENYRGDPSPLRTRENPDELQV